MLASPNFDMVRWNFHDSKDMIAKWERIESDEDEWKVEGGIRSGGRKLSRRMSELLGNFEYSEGGGGVTKLDDDVANCSEGGANLFKSGDKNQNTQIWPRSYYLQLNPKYARKNQKC